MFFFRNFSSADFQAINPQEARAAIRVDSPVHLEGNAPSIDVSLSSKNGTVYDVTLPLEIVREGTRISSDLPAAPNGQHWYLLALSASGQDAMRRLQTELRERQQEYDGFTLMVPTGEDLIPKSISKHFFFEAQLRMASGKDFITVFSGYRSIKEKS
jgi:hypothetical protein